MSTLLFTYVRTRLAAVLVHLHASGTNQAPLNLLYSQYRRNHHPPGEQVPAAQNDISSSLHGAFGPAGSTDPRRRNGFGFLSALESNCGVREILAGIPAIHSRLSLRMPEDGYPPNAAKSRSRCRCKGGGKMENPYTEDLSALVGLLSPHTPYQRCTRDPTHHRSNLVRVPVAEALQALQGEAELVLIRLEMMRWTRAYGRASKLEIRTDDETDERDNCNTVLACGLLEPRERRRRESESINVGA
ncbi:hypothetical protein B0H16DRAFT_1699774 [Mycena metata]|uniref:Uncharacterized protein n=1 Tax=Mycena metata TaxID=1033252 RepID=A0AAD7HHY1_9AGAR|nr:hypothetical protein B0H16DRAFT_1699774 [Mycena metata]